jgi:hypothetical protein
VDTGPAGHPEVGPDEQALLLAVFVKYLYNRKKPIISGRIVL